MPKNAKELAAAEIAVAGDDTATLTWRGLTLTVPKYSRWSFDALEALDDIRLFAFLREILGPEQWEAVKATTPRPVQADAIELSDLIGAAATSVPTLGESQASADS